MKAFAWAASLLLFLAAPSLAAAPPATQCVATAVASGTPDAIRIPKLPCIATTTLLVLTANGGNTTTTPTISVNGATPQIIKRYTGAALQPMDIPAAGTRVTLTNNGVNWFLLAPGLGIGANLFGPGAATSVGHPAAWNNTTGTLLGMPDQMQMTPTITAVPGDSPSNSALWINATRSGAATGADDNALAHLFHTETMSDTVASRGIDTINVNHLFGGHEGSRSAIFANLQNTAPTGVGPSDHSFYTAIFGNVAAAVSDGGTALDFGHSRGNFFSLSGQAVAYTGATNISSLNGGEVDISVQAGASVIQKTGLGVVLFNNDAVRGSLVDAGLYIAKDPATGATATLADGIVFGKQGFANSWPFDATSNIIEARTFESPGAQASNGIEFSGVSFAGCAFHSSGFCVTDGANGVLLSRPFPTLTFRDNNIPNPCTNGGNVRLSGLGASPDSYEWMINTAAGCDFSTAIHAFRVDAAGVFTAFLASTFQQGLFVGPPPAGPPGPPPTAGYYAVFSDANDGNVFSIAGHDGLDITMNSSGTVIKFPNIPVTPSGKQPLCIDAGTKQIYQGSGAAC